MTEKIDSRFRGNDIGGAEMTEAKHFTPTLVLPPQRGGNIRIEIAMT
jgi:hypothetical protein